MRLGPLIILLLLMPAVFADCKGYTESFDARVFDAKLRPIQDVATITVKYDSGTSFGSQYFTTPPQKTDANGMVHFDIANQGTTTRSIDCNIYLTGSVAENSVQRTIVVKQHPNPVDLTLADVYPVQFQVKDQTGAGLPNASVTIGNRTFKTDSRGFVKAYYRAGSYSYLANYFDARQAGAFNVTNDTAYEVVFPYYMITIDIVDDRGAQLNATLTVFNQTLQIDNGHFESNKSYGEEIAYHTEYSGLVIEGTAIPSQSTTVRVVYDVHSPTIGDIAAEVVNGRPRLTMPISDDGTYPSGLNFQSLKVTYRLEPADETTPWANAVTYTTGKEKFAADFPALPANKIVDYNVEIKDKSGNKAIKEGQFITKQPQQPENNTQNQSNTQPKPPEEQGIPLFYIIGGVIIILLAIYVAFRFKSKQGGSA